MQIPNDEQGLLRFARERIEECMYSREQRRTQSAAWRQLYYTGSVDGYPSKYNRCYSHVDKLSSFIFSPADLRLTLEFEGDALPNWQPKTDAASNLMNRRFKRSNVGDAISQANETSLVEGVGIVKLQWGPRGKMLGFTIRPSFFGVMREDLNSLDVQECMVHSYYVTEAGFARMVANNRDAEELKTRVSHVAVPAASADLTGDSYFHQILAQGMGQISYTPGNARAMGTASVAFTAPQAPMLAPEVLSRLIQIDDIWVWNDDATDAIGRKGDWTTLRYVEPGMLVEGKYQKRNLSDIPGEHPFTKICSNEIQGSFWGRSEMAVLFEPQRQLTNRVNDIDAIWKLRAKPPRAFTGFNSVTDERALALLAPGGSITEQASGAKVDNLAPDMPPEALDYVNKLEDIFDDVAGFTNILSGQGEPGVRAGVHAGTLLRTSTPRLRDRALMLERQAGEIATKALHMHQAKEAVAIIPGGDAGQEFLLAQLPADAIVTVDSHTSSPAFVDDNRQTAFALAKAEAIDGRTLIEMLHPPREDVLIARFEQRQQAQAAADAANPVAAAERAKGK